MASGADLYGEARVILQKAAARLGVPAGDAELLHLHSNASFVLPAAGLLVRIAMNPAAFTRVATSLEVTRWLAARGFPCVTPADIAGQPITEDGHVVSLWRYVPAVPGPAHPGAELGRLLHQLHTQPDPPRPPGRFTDPFYSVASAIEEAPDAMAEPDRIWLQQQITRLRAEWGALAFPRPPGLIHGDAHVGNLIQAASGDVVPVPE